MRWQVVLRSTLLLTDFYVLINAQFVFDTRVGSTRGSANVTARLDSLGAFGIGVSRKLPDTHPNFSNEEDNAGLEEDPNTFQLRFRVEGGGQGNRGKGNGKGKGPPPGRGNGNGRQNAGGNKNQGKKKGHNPCGPHGQFCSQANYIDQIGLDWSTRVQNGTGFFVRGNDGGRRYVPIGFQEPNDSFGSCNTPSGEFGYCRHLEHCILEEFRGDFLRFLEYTCSIPYGNYVGVCCPEEIDDPIPRPLPPNTGRPPSKTTTPFPFTFPPPRVSPKPVAHEGCGFIRILRITGAVVTNSYFYLMGLIVGGRIADPKAWTWMAALIRSKPESGFQAKDIKIRLGEYDFSNTRIQSSPEDFEVLSITVHEEFNRYSYQNDIALLRLARSAYFNNKIRPICLPPPFEDKTYENEIGIVTGWGTIYYGGPTSNTLMEVSVPIWKQDDCKAAYTQPIEDTNLCAGVRSGSRDSCQGDSGNKLICTGVSLTK
ncbi:Proclotting enzyme [Folsomia candida]|uniref:Proclotting enzyme n=1 Tax=Folsomia candida TaxID=158441 RepID=A0A226ENF6_FOLCA|nr:Proclotting enzyme [Folsomia candida]